MAKTYILEPTKLQFRYSIPLGGGHGLSTNTEDFNISDFVEGQTELNVSEIGIALKYAGAMPSRRDDYGNVSYTYMFTEDGTLPEIGSELAIYAIYSPSEEGSGPLPTIPAALNILSQTPFDESWVSGNTYELTTSIYTDEGEGDTTPETIAKLSKNVTYELHPHNDIDRIRFKGNLTNKENEEES